MPPESLALPPVQYPDDDQEKAKRHQVLWKYTTNKPISCLAISSLGHRIAMGGDDHYLYYFDKEKELLWDYNCLSPVTCIAMNDSGSNIAVGTDKHVLLLNAKGELVWENKIGTKVTSLIMTNSGDLIGAGCTGHKVIFYDSAGNIVKQHRTVAKVSKLCKTDDDKYFIATSEATIMLFDRRPELIWNYKTQWNIQAVTISGLGEIIVVGAMTSIYCLNNRRDLLWKHTGKNLADTIEVSRSKDYILIGGRDGILSSYNVMGNLIWQYKTGSVKATAKKLVTKGVTATQINETGQHIAVGSVNKNAYFLSRNQELLYKFEANDEITGVAMSKVGATLAIVAGNTIHLIENVGLYPFLFDQMSQKIREAHENRIDVSKPVERYRSSIEEYRKGNYEQASAYLMSVIKQIDVQQNVGIKELLSKITINMAKAEVADKDLTSVKEMLARAKEIYKMGDFYRAVASFHQVISRLESLNREEAPPPRKEVSAPEMVPAGIPPIKSKPPKPSEVPLPAPRDRIVSKREAAPAPVQEEIAVQRMSDAEILKRNNLMREVMERLEKFEKRISSLESDGMNVNSLEEVAKEARSVFNNGEYQKAADFIKLGEKEASLFLKRSEKKRALDLLSNITMKLTNASSKGIDTTESELIMAKGVKAFENDMFAESIAIIEKLGADIERMIQRSSPRYGNVRQLIKQVSDEIRDLKTAGMYTIDLEDMIDDCWVHLDSDIAFVESLVKEANEKIKQLKTQHEGIMEDFRESLSRIEALENKGYNTTRVQGTYQDALIVLYSGNLKKALEHLERLTEELDELEQESGSDEGLLIKAKSEPLVDTLKEKIAHLQDEIINKNEELSKKEHQISEFYITIREMEEKLADMERSSESLKDCPSCSHPSPMASKFCGECGYRFEMNCPNCGTAIPEGFQFCGKCGTKFE